jgi:hypothetical protein
MEAATSFFESTRVSVFKNALSTEPVDVALKNFIFSQKHRPSVDAVRAATDKARRNELKKHLPAATISGTFTVRKREGISKYNGLVALDFDEADNPGTSPEEMKQRLAVFNEVAYAGLSASGRGVWAIVPTNNTNPEHHALVVETLIETMARYDLYADKACKDVCRLRYFSYDANAYIRTDAVHVFDAVRIIEFKQRVANEFNPYQRPRTIITREKANTRTDDERTYQQVADCITMMQQRNIDLTADYDQWVRLGMALASEFGSQGENLYHAISSMHPKYNYQETTKKYLDFCRNGSKVKIGSFFHICSSNGITLK